MKKYLVILLSAGFVFSQNAISYTTISLTNPKGDWVSFFNTLEATCNINTFIETGTYLGDTTALAAEVFPIIHTIELLPTFYEKAVERFQYNYNVTVHLGDSAKIFPTLLPTLATAENQVLFWLDGHVMDCQSEDEKEFSTTAYTPIMQELTTIKNINFEGDVLLIDDLRLFGTLLDNQRLPLAGKREYPLLADVCALMQDSYSYKVFGDVLLMYEKSLDLTFSPVIEACTISRVFDGTNYTTQEILTAESIIANAQGQELQAIQSLYKDFSAPWIRAWYNKSPHYNLWYGLTLQNQNDHIHAIAQFQEVISLGYNHWRVFWYLAQSLYQTNHFDEARAALTVVLEKANDFYDAQTLMEQIQYAATGY